MGRSAGFLGWLFAYLRDKAVDWLVDRWGSFLISLLPAIAVAAMEYARQTSLPVLIMEAAVTFGGVAFGIDRLGALRVRVQTRPADRLAEFMRELRLATGISSLRRPPSVKARQLVNHRAGNG